MLAAVPSKTSRKFHWAAKMPQACHISPETNYPKKAAIWLISLQIINYYIFRWLQIDACLVQE